MPTILTPSVSFDELRKLFEQFRMGTDTVEAGVAATGDAAAYANVWEWGNMRQTKQGPKTIKGVNPNGDSVWMSMQAPSGYIAKNEIQYWEIVKIEIGKMPFTGNLHDERKAALFSAAEQCADIIAQNAPVDSGQLRDSLHAVEDGDPALDSDPGGSIESRFSRVLTIGG